LTRLRLLHAIHDFLPRHRAGSEIYAYELTRELSKRHDVFVLTAEYDPAAAHGTIRWRMHEGIPVIEVVNNWEFADFAETYSSPRLNRQFGHVLDATRPDVLHVHNLLNLSFDLPRLARERGVPAVATLHDYTLACASGGQRVHVADAHVCLEIDTERCARCFSASPYHGQLKVGRLGRRAAGRQVIKLAGALRRRLPMAAKAAEYLPALAVTAADMQRRLAYSRHVFEQVERFVAPSAALRDEYVRLGLDRRRIEVSDYGFPAAPRALRAASPTVRFGFVGTLAWHKGAHVFLEALKQVRGGFEAHIYGDREVFPSYSGQLQRLAEGLPVWFHGAFDRDDVARTYASMDVLVVPSLWPENSPLVIHEAFLHGVAVVAARLGGVPDLVRDDVNGYLYDGFRADDLADRLQRFVDDPSLPRRMAASAPVVKPIADDACEWEDRYQSVLEARSPAPTPV
jgi:glycosyltransferase involved in cell wall biosynthesis